MALETQVKTTYTPPMNRGHIYLEMWYWLLDRIEDEQDDDKRYAMNSVNLAMQGGIDNNSLAVQYDCAMKAIDTAKKLNLHLIASNLESLTNDVLYSDFQPHPVVQAQAVEREIDEALRTETVKKVTVSRSWAERHLNVDVNGFEAELDKAFGKGKWILA